MDAISDHLSGNVPLCLTVATPTNIRHGTLYWVGPWTSFIETKTYTTHSKKFPGRGAGRGADLSATI